MADTLRNETTVTLDGQERTLRATFAAVRAIEAAMGKSIIAVVTQAGNGDLSLTDAVTVIHHGLRGNDDKRLTLEQVGDACMELGFADASLAAISFLSNALQGSRAGKPRPETAPQ